MESLKRCLSADRMSKYLRASQGNLSNALTLYNWNTAVSAAFYGPLKWLEVTLRNSIDHCLAEVYGDAWYSHNGARFDYVCRRQVKQPRWFESHRGANGRRCGGSGSKVSGDRLASVTHPRTPVSPAYGEEWSPSQIPRTTVVADGVLPMATRRGALPLSPRNSVRCFHFAAAVPANRGPFSPNRQSNPMYSKRNQRGSGRSLPVSLLRETKIAPHSKVVRELWL